MIITIHQPNFMPWYPFFQKMQSADLFIVLTCCQFEKNNFQNRFNMNGVWHTMSVHHGLRPINEKQYVDANRDWKKIKGALPAYLTVLELFDECISESLSDTNTAIITKIASLLGIESKIVLDEETEATGTERLIRLCRSHGAKEYISGTSGTKYLDLAAFECAGIKVTYQNESQMVKKPILELLKDRVKL